MLSTICWLDAFDGYEEEVNGEGKPEGDDDIGDVKAGIEIRADAGGEGEGGIEGGAVGMGGGRDATEEAQAEGVGGDQQGKGEERER